MRKKEKEKLRSAALVLVSPFLIKLLDRYLGTSNANDRTRKRVAVELNSELRGPRCSLLESGNNRKAMRVLGKAVDEVILTGKFVELVGFPEPVSSDEPRTKFMFHKETTATASAR